MEETKRDPTGRVLASLFATIVALIVTLMIISFPIGVYTIFYTKLSNSTNYGSPVSNVLLFVALVPFKIPVHSSVGTTFVAFLSVYAAFFAVAAIQRVTILSSLRSLTTGAADALFQNPLLATVTTLGAVTFGLTVLDIVQTRSGIPTGQLSGDPLYLFLGITMAPLTEEFGFRLLLIGVPTFLATLAFNRSVGNALRTLWKPSSAWNMPGFSADTGNDGGTGTKLLAYALLSISSVAFGLVHYLSNSGWDVGKVSEAAIAGVALGYLYIRYGFHTNVLLHWGVNYFGTVYAFLGQGLWNIPWTSDTGSSLSLFVEILVILGLGVPSFMTVVYKFLKRASGATKGTSV